MSMNGVIVRLTESDLAWLRNYTPGRTGQSDDESGVRPSGDRTEAWFSADNPNAYELEEAFAGVHFLLTGSHSGGDGPPSFVANAAYGESVPYDLGFGPGRVFESPAVGAIADSIESLSAKAVRQRLESDELRSLHPFAQRPLEDDDKEWLLAVLQGLMTFMRRAATDGVPVLVAVV